MDIDILTLQNNVLIPSFSRTTKSVDARDLLIQRVVKCLLTVKGSDRFSMNFGIGLQNVLPKVYSPSLLDKAKVDITSALVSAEKQIKEEDHGPPEGRLQSLNLKNLTFDKTQWVVDIAIRDMTNTIFSVNVGV